MWQELQSNVFISVFGLHRSSVLRLADYWETQPWPTGRMSPWNLFHCGHWKECNMKERKNILVIWSSTALILRKENSLLQFQLFTSQPLIIYLHYFLGSLSSYWCSAFRVLRVGALLCLQIKLLSFTVGAVCVFFLKSRSVILWVFSKFECRVNTESAVTQKHHAQKGWVNLIWTYGLWISTHFKWAEPHIKLNWESQTSQ